jgi:hypothetical protein
MAAEDEAGRTTYTDEFLGALGNWQRGWKEDRDERMALTESLRTAIAGLPALPPEAREAPAQCYRKRFLVPNNPQNGGDFWQFFWDGEIAEGVSSWSTDYNYCKVIFKPDPRPGTTACIFRRTPAIGEVILNIAGLWSRSDFSEAAESFIEKGGPAAKGLNHFRATQSEVILDAPLTMDDVFAFCGQIPSLEHLCKTAGIATPDDEDELWQRLLAVNYLPTMPYWVEGDAPQRAINRAIAAIETKFRQYLVSKDPSPAA